MHRTKKKFPQIVMTHKEKRITLPTITGLNMMWRSKRSTFKAKLLLLINVVNVEKKTVDIADEKIVFLDIPT